jgi:UDP-glucose 4-epimerase
VREPFGQAGGTAIVRSPRNGSRPLPEALSYPRHRNSRPEVDMDFQLFFDFFSKGGNRRSESPFDSPLANGCSILWMFPICPAELSGKGPFMSETCLVTGGAGFIGSHLVEGLSRLGRRVRVLDDFSTGLHKNLAAIQPAPELIAADVSDPAVVERAMQGVDRVFHLAALASVQRSIEAPADTHRVCATGTLHVLDAARRAGVRRVVYAASSSAYGIPAGELQKETDPLQPLSPYAAAKLAGELYAESFSHSFGLETVRLRFFNIFGPRQRADSPYSGVIALFTGMIASGRAPTVHGDGLQSRDFTYVTDVVQALLKAADAPSVSGRVYNIGTGRSTTVLDLAAALNRLMGKQLTPQHGPPRAGDVRQSCADISRARAELGYEPAVAFEDGLARTLEWYRQESAAGGPVST